ncbi:hypothetical protein DPEC_G00206850 [Dallia pectoralis]|uniref:Uncharacterized protein n=1 Tax=Dallia pectoralis TaxID=75939 RepID=A0ACC2G4Z5_DALPE|nr:hypothetical protein DPEC_G00206850 [Dallia pectoralis]
MVARAWLGTNMWTGGPSAGSGCGLGAMYRGHYISCKSCGHAGCRKDGLGFPVGVEEWNTRERASGMKLGQEEKPLNENFEQRFVGPCTLSSQHTEVNGVVPHATLTLP